VSDGGAIDTPIDEDLHRIRRHQRHALAVLALLVGDDPASQDITRAVGELALQMGLPQPQVTELESGGRLGGALKSLIAEARHPEFADDPALELLASLLLLAIRTDRTGGPLDRVVVASGAAADALPLLEAGVRGGAARGKHGDLKDALAEVLRPPPFVRSAVSAAREARRPSPRVEVGRINPERYRHTLDVQATAAVQRLLPFDDAARKLSDALPERYFRLQNATSHIRVAPDQFGGLYAIYTGCVKRLGIHPEPPLYLQHGGLNAYTAGVEQPFIVITDALVGVATRAELEFVIGHELGHIKFDHVLFLMLATLLRVPAHLLGMIPLVGPMLKMGLELALFEWQRKAELSCDRAGLLCCQDPDAAFRMMMRLAGAPTVYSAEFNVDAFIAQYDDLQVELKDLTSRLFYVITTMRRSHPWLAVRARVLRTWIDEGAYRAFLNEGRPVVFPAPISPSTAPSPDPLPYDCPGCKAQVPAGFDACPRCHTAIGVADQRQPCGNCGAPLATDHRFCVACGTRTQGDGVPE
jgi:Zn-dependent protease with chaperone function